LHSTNALSASRTKAEFLLSLKFLRLGNEFTTECQRGKLGLDRELDRDARTRHLWLDRPVSDGFKETGSFFEEVRTGDNYMVPNRLSLVPRLMRRF
jgi:hypothetical protein